MPYTREGMLAQVFVALGQGTGAVRISHAACRALGERYEPRIDDAARAEWGSTAVQVLERIRAIGRTAAAQAGVAGENALSAGRVIAAARQVESVSLTPLCPPDPYALGPSEEILAQGTQAAEVYTHEGVLAQVFAAFGQGTGAVRVAHDACLALRERYEPLLDDVLLAAWGREGVQVLERIRAIGRAAATRTSLHGGIAINRDEALAAMESVEALSGTYICSSLRRANAPAEPEPAFAALIAA
jgi:hypothetical protein